ncbi:hypothetical protein HYV82_05745 [Candidatus Woesearchaeota archaeon]|nr:hypothetical protein [Candidatus Woesearchaeota archaeon]
MAQNLVQRVLGDQGGHMAPGLASGLGFGLLALGVGFAIYLHSMGQTEIEKAQQPRYQTIQTIANNYAAQMSPDQFRQYLKDLELVKPK